MEEKKQSELLQRIAEIIEELRQLTDNDTQKSFIIMARDAGFDDSVHMIATGGVRGELSKNIFGLLAVSRERAFVVDALQIYSEYLVSKIKPEMAECVNLLTDNKHLN